MTDFTPFDPSGLTSSGKELKHAENTIFTPTNMIAVTSIVLTSILLLRGIRYSRQMEKIISHLQDQNAKLKAENVNHSTKNNA